MTHLHARTIRALQITQRLRDESPLQLLPRGVSGFGNLAVLDQLMKDLWAPAVQKSFANRSAIYDTFITSKS